MGSIALEKSLALRSLLRAAFYDPQNPFSQGEEQIFSPEILIISRPISLAETKKRTDSRVCQGLMLAVLGVYPICPRRIPICSSHPRPKRVPFSMALRNRLSISLRMIALKDKITVGHTSAIQGPLSGDPTVKFERGPCLELIRSKGCGCLPSERGCLKLERR